MRIQHNIMALNSYRQLSGNNSALSKNLEKLSSGYRINRAGDDAAGLAISEKMRAQIKGLEAAQKNANDGISLVQTAEGALTEVHSMLNRMVYLASQSANGTYDNETDRYQLQKEMDQLRDEIDRIADSSNFNGIKLLDGSMDAESTNKLSTTSPISNITTKDFESAGASEAFESSYITNRPPAETVQTNAKFTVNLNAVDLSGAQDGDVISLTIGDKQIDYTLATGDAAKFNSATGLAELADAIATKGGISFNTAPAAAANTMTTGKTTTELKADINAGTAGKYIEIDGHIWEMGHAANSQEITFTQVDFMGKDGKEVIPNYGVSITGTDKTKTTPATDTDLVVGTNQQPNWQVQKTTAGTGIGTSHQARVDVEIDFSKLKDGDKLTVGDKTYLFKLDSANTATDSGNTKVVDLSGIFKTDADKADAGKQNLAITKIVGDMGAANSTLWTIGNYGADDGKGKISFQSLDTYTDGATAIDGKPATAPKAKMDTEANVMEQFFSTTNGSPASVSFELDVTKIKEGDTFTIDGTTFEFTDGTYTSEKDHVAIDLSAYGIANEKGIPSSSRDNILAAIVSAVDANVVAGSGAKYTTTADGNKLTLTSKDQAGTTKVNEAKVAAKIELPQSSYAGRALTLQIGDTADDYNKLSLNIKDAHVAALGLADISIADQDSASSAIDAIKNAINQVSDIRGSLGAVQNRLEHTINNLGVQTENITAAESRIRDTDMAEEMMAYTKNNILVQAAQAMLAQANQVPQGILQLLQ